MTDNFFIDNADLQLRLDQLDLREAVQILEREYAYHSEYASAPRNYEDAKHNYRLILELLGEICAQHIAPGAAEADEEEAHLEDGRVVYPEPTRRALELLRQADLTGAMLPYKYGGLNIPGSIFQMMIEIISRADAGLMTLFGLQEISATIEEFGSEEMKERFLPRFVQGEVTGAMVLTEPDAGSDLGSIQTRAIYDESEGIWRLKGVKRFITNGCADVQLVLARSEEGSDDARGLSLFLVENDETVHVRRLEHKLGIRSTATCEIEYRGTPAELVGKRRFGLIRYAMSMMNGARLGVSAQALGIAEAAYREARRYAAKRVQFDQPIESIPAVYRMLLSMKAEIEATRALVYETARWVDLKRALERHIDEAESPSPDERKRAKRLDRLTALLTPLVKYHATEAGNRVCYQAMQIHGGAGYMREFDVERHYRDMRVTSIYEGTSQLQVVAATGGLLRHRLDGLLEKWMALELAPELSPLRQKVTEATALLNDAIDHLKAQEQAVIEYYASDLIELAAHVINCWLVLRDADISKRKRELAQVYITETLPRIQAASTALQTADPALLEVQDLIPTPSP